MLKAPKRGPMLGRIEPNNAFKIFAGECRAASLDILSSNISIGSPSAFSNEVEEKVEGLVDKWE